ncbi:hypothetical protein J6590_091521 [Homalodisca vitripennis]|nr:hypothetical protein J6590_091521 [Homalodisca vitripennis]
MRNLGDHVLRRPRAPAWPDTNGTGLTSLCNAAALPGGTSPASRAPLLYCCRMEVESAPHAATELTTADPSNGDESWQSVQPRKRGRRASTSSESSTRNFAPAQNIPGNTVGERRQPRIPPIIIQGVTAWTSLLRRLKSAGCNFEAKYVGTRLHILCKSEFCFRTAQRELLDAKLAFHTFSLKEEQELKTVIRGLPAWTSPEDIAEDLRFLIISPS